jgi:rod shape-determining protein MreB
VRDGVIADYTVTEAMLRHFIRKVIGRNPLLRPQIMMSTPKGVTSVERRAVYDAAIQAGAKEAYLIPEPLAAAYGAGMPINTPTGNMVVDIGGGTSEAAVVSMNDIVVWSSVRVGGNRIDQAIISYIRKKYNLIIGEQTAEELKIQIGSATPLEDELTMDVRGRDQVTGLPKTISVSSEEVTEAIRDPLAAILGAVRQTLEKTPPELASDIIDRGMVLTGGGAQLRNVDQLLTQETGVPCFAAENPIACVSIGAGRALENLDVMRRFLPQV